MAAKAAIDSGGTMTSLFRNEETFSVAIRHHRGLNMYADLTRTRRNWEMEVIVLYGGTGTGKTRWAYDNYGETLYSVPQAKGSGCYWDNYDGQETVLIDEMYGSRFSWGFLLKMLDRQDHEVPYHGGQRRFNSHRIIFTSNIHPHDWYGGTPKDRHPRWTKETNPLCRRITHLICTDDVEDMTKMELIHHLPETILVSASRDAIASVVDQTSPFQQRSTATKRQIPKDKQEEDEDDSSEPTLTQVERLQLELQVAHSEIQYLKERIIKRQKLDRSANIGTDTIEAPTMYGPKKK